MTLLIDDDDRYGRQRLITWWDQERLQAARVLVVGAGALGNEVLKNLALVGVGYLAVVDFDRIESSNLTRSVLFRADDCGRSKAETAALALRDLNPDVEVDALNANVLTDVGLGWFRDVDLVVGCLDNREARLWVNRCCWKVNRPWIDGAVQEINGVVKVFRPPDGPCYECTMTDNDFRLISLRYSCPQLPRDEWLSGKVPTTPTIASIIGGLQAQEALKLLHGLPSAANHALILNGVANNFYRTQFTRREGCLSHETYPEPIALPLSSVRHTARELLTAVRESAGSTGPLAIRLERDLVVTLTCDHCRRTWPVGRPRVAVEANDALCESCQALARPEIVHEVSEESPLADQSLAQLGVPAYDIVQVIGGAEEWFVSLAADAGPRRPAAPLVVRRPASSA